MGDSLPAFGLHRLEDTVENELNSCRYRSDPFIRGNHDAITSWRSLILKSVLLASNLIPLLLDRHGEAGNMTTHRRLAPMVVPGLKAQY